MKTYRIYQVDAFTKTKFEGNPAGVVANADGLSDDQMQSIARELNNAETAFILSPTAPDHDVWIRFFTPTTEVPTCGHATISAHYVRALENDLTTCRVQQRIGIGILPVDIVYDKGDFSVVMTQGTPDVSDILSARHKRAIVDALGLSAADLDAQLPMQIASTGHAKVMVGIKSRDKLNELQPDLTRLTQISKQIECNGYFVFTLDNPNADILSYGRMFAPAIGIPEDPVTGNANGPLGAYLGHHNFFGRNDGSILFKGKQGEAIGRPGIVTVRVEIDKGRPISVQVRGDAVIAFRTEMTI